MKKIISITQLENGISINASILEGDEVLAAKSRYIHNAWMFPEGCITANDLDQMSNALVSEVQGWISQDEGFGTPVADTAPDAPVHHEGPVTDVESKTAEKEVNEKSSVDNAPTNPAEDGVEEVKAEPIEAIASEPEVKATEEDETVPTPEAAEDSAPAVKEKSSVMSVEEAEAVIFEVLEGNTVTGTTREFVGQPLGVMRSRKPTFVRAFAKKIGTGFFPANVEAAIKVLNEA